jgi:hypothetical protein
MEQMGSAENVSSSPVLSEVTEAPVIEEIKLESMASTEGSLESSSESSFQQILNIVLLILMLAFALDLLYATSIYLSLDENAETYQ